MWTAQLIFQYKVKENWFADTWCYLLLIRELEKAIYKGFKEVKYKYKGFKEVKMLAFFYVFILHHHHFWHFLKYETTGHFPKEKVWVSWIWSLGLLDLKKIGNPPPKKPWIPIPTEYLDPGFFGKTGFFSSPADLNWKILKGKKAAKPLKTPKRQLSWGSFGWSL